MGNRSSVWVSNSLREGLDQCHLFPVNNTGMLRKLMGYSHLQSFLHPVNLEDELLVKSGGGWTSRLFPWAGKSSSRI